MWQVVELPDGTQVVSSSLSESMTLMLARPHGAPLFVNIYTDEAEPRLFDKARLPLLTVDGKHIFDLNESMEFQNLLENLDDTQGVHYFSEDRQVGAQLWNGEKITPNAFIIKMMQGENLHVRVFFNPFAMSEYNVSLDGFSDAIEKVFSVSTAPPPRVAPASIDRTAIKSMVEDFWRSFISVAVNNPQVGFQSIQRFDEQIQTTASLMASENSKIYLQAVEEEREKLFDEYNRNPEDLKRRLGLAAAPQTPVIPHSQRQSMAKWLSERLSARRYGNRYFRCFGSFGEPGRRAAGRSTRLP